MKANGCEKLSDEWWVMEIEWPNFVGQTGSKWSDEKGHIFIVGWNQKI